MKGASLLQCKYHTFFSITNNYCISFFIFFMNNTQSNTILGMLWVVCGAAEARCVVQTDRVMSGLIGMS